jgi:hypothetical protein
MKLFSEDGSLLDCDVGPEMCDVLGLDGLVAVIEYDFSVFEAKLGMVIYDGDVDCFWLEEFEKKCGALTDAVSYARQKAWEKESGEEFLPF